MIDLIVIAKEPRPGRVKTRLTPPYRQDEAAALAAASLLDTLDTVVRTRAARRVLALDGRPERLPPRFEVIRQRGGGLDERLANAFDDAYAGRPMALIGMDTPQVTTGLLEAAGAGLAGHDAVLGPAADGGFWLLGLRFPDPALLRGVPMSTAHTGADQLARLRSAGLTVALLPELADFDTAADVARVAAEAPPYGRFARAARSLAGAVA